jgi:hypothetical protein
MAQVSVTGYTDKPSVIEGEEISFYVTADNATEAQVDIVRLIHGDEDPKGPGFQEELIHSDFSGVKPVKKQFVDLGNAVRVPDPTGKLALTDSLTIATYVHATTPEKGRQVLLGKFSLAETEGPFATLSLSIRSAAISNSFSSMCATPSAFATMSKGVACVQSEARGLRPFASIGK